MESFLAGAHLPADWILLTILVFFAALGGSRGFYDSLMPLVLTLISAALALILTWALKERAAEYLYAWARDQLLSRVDLSAVRSTRLEDIVSQLERLLPDTLLRMAGKLGLELRDFVAEAARSAPGAVGQKIAENAASALLLPVTESAARIGLFFGFFLGLRLVFGLAARVTGLAFRLPAVRWADRLGGAVLGFVRCVIVMYILFWLLELFFPAVFAPLAEGSRLLTLFFAEK